MSDSNYVVVRIKCPHCEQEQDVHVRARGKVGQTVREWVTCKKCEKPYEVMLPDEIMAGEFLPG